MNIDWSNATIQGVVIGGIIGLAGVVIAAIAGYFGAKAGARIGADAAKESARITQLEAQADRDEARRAREADRQDARLDRFADRKLSLAVDMLLAADLHSDQSRIQVAEKVDRWNFRMEYDIDIDEPLATVGPTQPVREALQALDLVAPGIAEPAGDLYLATLPLGSLAARWMDLERPDASRWAEEWANALERWDEARSTFVTAVRADLGVDLDRLNG